MNALEIRAGAAVRASLDTPTQWGEPVSVEPCRMHPREQVCRDCGTAFPFDPDRDRCPSCTAATLGEQVYEIRDAVRLPHGSVLRLGTFVAPSARDALAAYAVEQGYADPRTDDDIGGGDYFTVATDGTTYMAIEDHEVYAVEVER